MEIGTPLPIDDEIISYEDDLHELIYLMPAVTEKVKGYGCLDTYMKWCRMMSDGSFPNENICFRLFLDVIE